MIKEKLRDFFRGYTDKDIEAVAYKMNQSKYPGAVIPVTKQEWKALCNKKGLDPCRPNP